MRRLSLCLHAALMLALSTAVGCSSSSNTDAVVQGNVTIDGVLASRGTVTFHPVKHGPVAIGQIHPDGSYSLRTGLGKTANPDDAKVRTGKYVVTVMVMGDSAEGELKKDDGSPPVAGPRLTSIKYASKDTSGLTFDIKPGINLIPLELEGAANDPPPEPQEEEGPAEDAESGEDVTSENVSDDAPIDAASDTESEPVSEVAE